MFFLFSCLVSASINLSLKKKEGANDGVIKGMSSFEKGICWKVTDKNFPFRNFSDFLVENPRLFGRHVF